RRPSFHLYSRDMGKKQAPLGEARTKNQIPRTKALSIGSWFLLLAPSRGAEFSSLTYQAKCAKALLDSAILMVFSRLFMASPSRREAAMSSSASRRYIGRPFLPRAAVMIQRIDRLCCRVLLTCMGTWYVAPPTRLERTSTVGLTCSTAWLKTSIGSASGMRFLIWSSAP